MEEAAGAPEQHSPIVVMRTHRGAGDCCAAALMMFAKATDIIGHGPPGTWPRQLTITSAPVTTALTLSNESASPTTTFKSLASWSESLLASRTRAVTLWPASSAIREKTVPVAPVAPRTAIFIVSQKCSTVAEDRLDAEMNPTRQRAGRYGTVLRNSLFARECFNGAGHGAESE